MQPTLPTGTQVEEGSETHGNGVPSTIVGLLSASGEAVSYQQFFEPRYTTIQRWACPDSNQGFHRESLIEDVKIKTEPGMEPSEAKGSPQPSDVKRSPDYQGLERGFDDEKFKEEDRSLDLEDKP